jgi:hypothetical protein
LAGVASRSPQHTAICLRMAAVGLQSFPASATFPTSLPPDMATRYPFLASDADRRALIEYAMRWLLYQPRPAGPPVPRVSAGL